MRVNGLSRVVLAGVLLFTLMIFVIAAATWSARSDQSGRVALIFRNALGKLSGVRVPILLPTHFGALVSLNDKSLVVKTTASAHRYELRIDYTSDCNGANVCSAGSFGGADATYVRDHPNEARDYASGPRAPADADEREAIRAGQEILDRRTPLVSGLIGYYSQYDSGAGGGGNSLLRWRQNGAFYTILTLISTQSNLQAIADSAIRNGPITVATNRRAWPNYESSLSFERPSHHQWKLFPPECATVRTGSLIHDDIRTCIAQGVRPPPGVLQEERLLCTGHKVGTRKRDRHNAGRLVTAAGRGAEDRAVHMWVPKSKSESELSTRRDTENRGTLSLQRHAEPRLCPSANVLDKERLVRRKPHFIEAR